MMLVAKAATKASRIRDRQASAAADHTPPGQTHTSEDGLDLPLTQRALLGSVPTSTLMPASDSGIFPVFKSPILCVNMCGA